MFRQLVLAAALALPTTAMMPLSTAWAAPEWIVDKDKTKIGFSTTDAGNVFQGKFTAYEADIVFDPQDLDNSSVTVLIDLDSASTGAPDRDGSLPGATWFDVNNHPVATYKASEFKAVGGAAYVAKGELSLKGDTRQLDLPFSLEISGDTAHVQGETSLDRTDFNVGTGDYESGDTIGKKVTVTIDLTATKEE